MDSQSLFKRKVEKKNVHMSLKTHVTRVKKKMKANK